MNKGKLQLLGRKAKFSTTHSDGSIITFSAKIVKLVDDKIRDDQMFAWVEMPERVRKLPFPPLGGKRFGLYRVSDLQLV